MEHIELIESNVRIIIKEEVIAQLPQILPQAILDVATPVIENNVTESLEVAIVTRSSSQPQSLYEAAATLSEFKLTKILIDKMEKKNHLIDSRSKEKKSSSTFKDASQSQHKSFGKSPHAEEPSHTVEDLDMRHDQEFIIRDNDEQPTNKEVTKADWFKKPERPPTPDPDWRHVTSTRSKKLTNLTINKWYDLNVALRMYTRHIVIQRWMEDLQLGVESYQKKLNLTKPDTYRSNLRNKTAYSSYSNPHGIIYVDQFKRKRLMHTDELHKFSDGMLNDVRTALHDNKNGIPTNEEME
nr:hypothetical protein [Tanacetum cinerariifolium]